MEPRKMDLEEIDINLAVETTISREGLRFFDVEEEPFRIYGVYKDGGKYRRFPEKEAAKVSEKVYALHTFTAGGRVRFVTDSPYVAIKTDYTASRKPHFPLTASGGFDMYVEESIAKACLCPDDNEQDLPRYVGTFIPPYDVGEDFESVVDFEEQKERIITIHFPLYSEVRSLWIGLQEGASLKEAPKYKIENPVVFYGSSITQGGGASRPGNNYENIISRRLNCNHINLGFSGSARGEAAMAEYISKLEMSAFVLDYDHNSSTEELCERHAVFFKIIREAQPKLPIIILPRPRYYLKKDDMVRREIVYKTYQDAVKAGDKNVYFISGEKLMELAKGEGSVDYTHPNDFGFHSMARAVLEVLSKIGEGLL